MAGGSVYKKVLWLAMGWMAVAMPAWGQAASYVPTITFDVASVRVSKPGTYMTFGSAVHSSTLRVTGVNFLDLLTIAYGVRKDQIVGVSDSHTMFDIEARSDSAADERLAKLSSAEAQLEHQHMMQALLADRFRLKTHWETRDGLSFNLVVGKRGLKMPETKGDPRSADEVKVWGARGVPELYQKGDNQGGMVYIARGASMDVIVQMLALQLGRTVVDKTGLSGKYDFQLQFHGRLLNERAADDLDPVPPLDKAIEDQLGLKVEPSKGPVRMLVVDHIEMPSEN